MAKVKIIRKCPECEKDVLMVWIGDTVDAGCTNSHCKRYNPLVKSLIALQETMRQIADNQIEPIMAEKARKCLEELEAK